jgi:glycosyltransferase involved in cell wall biosynthesis
MKVYKICIWTPTITHHQSAFHDAIVKDGRIDLEVRYSNKISQARLALGWEDKKCTKSFEKRVDTLNDALESVSDFNKRVHIISGNGYDFTKELIAYCIKSNLKWVNWTERSGLGLFKLLRESSSLFKIFFPIYQRLYNRKFSGQIEKHALGTFVSGSKAEEDYLRRGVSKDKIKHLYYALEPLVNTTVIPKELKSSRFKYHFIYVGSLSHAKGIDILLKAYSKLDQNEWGLILVGKDTTSGQYQEIAKKLSIENNVTFTGAIDFDRVNEYMSFADVFILPTRFDGWGAVLNEATSLSLPVISTNECGAAYHLIENDKNGYMVKTNSIISLTNTMKKYVKMPDIIKQHGKYSSELFKQFLPEENVQRLIEALIVWDSDE